MHSRTIDTASNGLSRTTTYDKKGENGVQTFFAEDEDGTLRPAGSIIKKSSRRSSSGGGSRPKRQSSGQSQNVKEREAGNALHLRSDSTASRQNGTSAQGDGLSTIAEKPGAEPGLNGYLSTIYSERNTPVPSPSPGTSHTSGFELSGNSDTPVKRE